VDAQERMLKIWENIFKQPVAPDSDFFADLDGDSMAAAAVVHWIGIEFGVQVPMVEVFDRPTPAEITTTVLALMKA